MASVRLMRLIQASSRKTTDCRIRYSRHFQNVGWPLAGRLRKTLLMIRSGTEPPPLSAKVHPSDPTLNLNYHRPMKMLFLISGLNIVTAAKKVLMDTRIGVTIHP